MSRKEDRDTDEITEAHGYGFSSGYAGDYVVLQAIHGIQIWDWSDVYRPVQLSYLVLPGIGPSDYSLGAWWLSWQAPFVYVGGGSNGIYVVDASDPLRPFLVDRGAGRPNPLPITETGGFRIGPLFAVGNLLFASSMEGRGYVTLDIGDPRQPSVLAVEPNGPQLYSFLVNGNKLLGAGSDDFFHVHDVSDPRRVTRIGRVALQGRGGYLIFQDGFAHVGASLHYAKVDLRDPRHPAIVGTASSGLDGRDEDFATVLGNLVVVSDDHGWGSSLVPHQTSPDTTGPAVNMVVPATGAVSQLLSTRVGLTFTDLVDLDTVDRDTFIVRPVGGEALPGKYSTETGIVNFWPAAPLLPDRVYEVVVPAGGIRDHAGNAAETTFTSRFDTGRLADSPISCRVVPGTPVATGEEARLTVEATGSARTFAYSWDFGDGSAATPFEAHTIGRHRYAAAGRMPVTATVTDGVHWGRCSGIQTAHYPLTPVPPVASSPILIDEEEGLVWCVNPDHDSVSAIDRDLLAVRFEQAVGRGPRSLARAPDGTIWVVGQDDATIAVLDPATGSRIQDIALPLASRPYGLAFSPDGSAGYVSLEATGRLAKLDPRSRQVVSTLELGPWPRGIAISYDSSRILVTRFISPRDRGEVYEVDASSFTKRGVLSLVADPGPDTEASGRGVPNHVGSATISPDGRRAWVPSKKDNTRRGPVRDRKRLTFESTVRTIVSQIDLGRGREDLTTRRDLNDRDSALAAAFSPLGDYVFVVLQGSNRVDVLDAYSRALVTSIESAGRAPQGVVLSREGKLFILSYLSRELVVHDVSGFLASGAPVKQLAALSTMDSEPLPAVVLAGKQLFYNAQDPRMNRDGYLSCASCHLDGGEDGRVWDFTDAGEGLRNTISLKGRRGTGHGRVHWTANFDEIQDFEHDVRNRFGGAGFLSDEALDSGTRNQPLGDSKAGLSPELDALAAYLESLDKVPPSPHRNTDGSLSAEAESGKLIFQKFRCASCHAGLDFTDSGNGLLHDVGTLRGTSGRRLGRRLEGLDTPTLKGLWQTAPYLHDGSAATLAGVLTTANSKQRHGALRTASAAEVRDLVAYLLQIDEREPPPPPTLVAARIVAPADRARFYEGTPVSIEVEARSDLGPVSRVEIRDGTTRIGVDALAPYVFSWKGAKKGAHVLNAIVTHGSGTRTQSQPVTIGVEAPLQARVNFQPAAAKVPVGYLPDTGEVFGERGSGFSYGWNTDNAAQARDRNAARSPDQRYDTFTHFQEPANPQAEWEIALPAGSYRVRTVAGDPKSFEGVFRLMAEGVLVPDGSPTPAKRWLDASAIVPVEDGRLTIRAAPGAIGAKICFVEIVRVGAPP